MTEKQFMQAVVDLARMLGWLVFHPYDSRRSAPGYPDLTLVRGDRLLFAELKTDLGKTTPAQDRWLAALAAAGQDCRLWRPADWDGIVEVLR